MSNFKMSLILALVFVGYGLVGTMDYQDQKHAELAGKKALVASKGD